MQKHASWLITIHLILFMHANYDMPMKKIIFAVNNTQFKQYIKFNMICHIINKIIN